MLSIFGFSFLLFLCQAGTGIAELIALEISKQVRMQSLLVSRILSLFFLSS